MANSQPVNSAVIGEFLQASISQLAVIPAVSCQFIESGEFTAGCDFRSELSKV